MKLGEQIRSWALCLVSVLCLPGGSALAQSAAPACPPLVTQPTPEQIRAAHEAARDRGFLWRISKDGRSSYLYGTVHLGKLDWAPPGPAVRQALEASQLLALELDVSDSRVLQQLQQGFAVKPGEAPVPAALQRRLGQEVAAACLPATALNGQLPAVRALSLVVLAARWEGLDAAFAQEHVLTGYAQSKGMGIVSLETVEVQLSALLPKGVSERNRFIEQAMAQLQSGAARRGAKRITQAWADGRLEELANYEQWCECVNSEDDRQLLRRLNDERNPGIAARIDSLHASGKPVFAGVGALHMTGPQGLPLLLQQRGYEVERVSFAP